MVELVDDNGSLSLAALHADLTQPMRFARVLPFFCYPIMLGVDPFGLLLGLPVLLYLDCQIGVFGL